MQCTSDTNRRKLARLQAVLSEMLGEALRRGYFGTMSIELGIADGTIQHIRRKTERLEK